jgi:orotidine-5'-phosphate decarboxylase
MKDRLIVALDVDNLKKATSLVDALYPEVKIFKIGSQLFTKVGPDAVKMVHKKRARVFLDLKFHDIPNTVFLAIEQVCAMGVFMANVHASGGRVMMRRAAQAKKKSLIILAVTVLTSIDKKALSAIGINRSPLSQAEKLAMLAKSSGLDGVVCSGNEIRAIRKACGAKFIIVTPGIRPLALGMQDQKRVITPELAISHGADYIVAGRPVIQAKNPLSAAKDILDVLR